MPPNGPDDDDDDDAEEDDTEEDVAGEAGAVIVTDDEGVEAIVTTNGRPQTLVRLPRRRPNPPPPPPANDSGEPANVPPSPPAQRSRRRNAKPTPAAARRRPAPVEEPTETETPAVTNPIPPPPPPHVPSTQVNDNVFLVFEETLKLFPEAARTIAVERKTGTPAHWMLTDRPRTANELYAAIKRLHGRSGETTYEIVFRDGSGHGSAGLVSMPSTLDELPAPIAPAAPYQPPHYPQPGVQSAYAPPVPAPANTPLEAMLTMQKQLFEMVNAMQASKSAAAASPPTAPAVPAASSPDVNALLAMQKQMFEMVQAMQTKAAGYAPPQQQPPATPPPQAPVQPDPSASLLAVQKQMFEMMQAMQATATGHAPAPQAAASSPAAAPTGAADSIATTLAMQKQMFEMMLTMMQAVQQGPASGVRPAAAPYYRPRYPDADPRAAGAPQYPPSARPQTPSEQLRDAVSVVRSTFEVAREFGAFGGSASVESPLEEDDSPVRVIDMGPAKGVINRVDGSLRGVETFMANLPDILKWVGEQGAEIRKAKEEDRRQRQPRLPPGFVMAGPDYQPPEGFVAIPVDQIPPQAQTALPEPPAEMPPPIAPPEASSPRRQWGMPGAR